MRHIQSHIHWIISKMQTWAPEDTAEDFDNVGLLVGNPDWPVNKVLVALDATDAVIKEAIDGGYQCIITHHPLAYHPLKKIIQTDPIGRKILALAQHQIGLYTAHTNLDKAPGGVNDVLANALALGYTIPLAPDANNPSIGIGRIGKLPDEFTLEELAHHVKLNLNLNAVRYGGELNKKIKKIAICGGSGMGFASYVKNSGCDVYITGDVKYSDALPLIESGIAILDITHYSGENLVVAQIVHILSTLAKKENLAIEFKSTTVNSQTFFSL